MGATDVQTELLNISRTSITSPENSLKINVLESRVVDRAWLSWREVKPVSSVHLRQFRYRLKCIWHLFPDWKWAVICFTLCPRVSHCFIQVRWMVSGCSQALNEGILPHLSVQKVFCYSQTAQCEKGKWASTMHPRLCHKLVTRWEAVTNGPLVGSWGWSAYLKIKERQPSLQWEI